MAEEDLIDAIRDVATVKESVRNMTETVNKISFYLATSNERHIEIMTQLAEMKKDTDYSYKKQNEVDNELEKCDKELRKHHDRIVSCESFQKRQIKYVVTIASAVALFISHGKNAFDSVKAYFS